MKKILQQLLHVPIFFSGLTFLILTSIVLLIVILCVACTKVAETSIKGDNEHIKIEQEEVIQLPSVKEMVELMEKKHESTEAAG